MRNVGGNARVLRRINNDVVLDALKGGGDASLAELARATGLSLATCANIVGDLVGQGDVVELGEKTSRGGRPARRFRFNPDNSQFASIFLKAIRAGEIMKVVVTNYSGTVLGGLERKVRSVTVETVDAVIRDVMARFPLVKAAALSIPGLVRDGLVTSCELAGLAGVHVEERVRAGFGIRAVAENDMNFAAMGYYAGLADPAVSGLAYVLVPEDFCIGSGIIVNGALVKGKSNFAGEISRLPLAGASGKPFTLPAGRGGRVRGMAKIVVAITAVVNPDVLVFAGEGADAGMVDEVRKECLRSLDAAHLPAMTHKRDYEEDCLAGMVAMARSRASFPVQMVERSGN